MQRNSKVKFVQASAPFKKQYVTFCGLISCCVFKINTGDRLDWCRVQKKKKKKSLFPRISQRWFKFLALKMDLEEVACREIKIMHMFQSDNVFSVDTQDSTILVLEISGCQHSISSPLLHPPVLLQGFDHYSMEECVTTWKSIPCFSLISIASNVFLFSSQTDFFFFKWQEATKTKILQICCLLWYTS